MADSHSAAALLSTLLLNAEEKIVPLTRAGVASGSKVLGAATLAWSNLAPVRR